jgi:hypothetical protein
MSEFTPHTAKSNPDTTTVYMTHEFILFALCQLEWKSSKWSPSCMSWCLHVIKQSLSVVNYKSISQSRLERAYSIADPLWSRDYDLKLIPIHKAIKSTPWESPF